jgi:Transposase DDE domain.
MGNYSVPEEIRALKPRGTRVKNIGGHYYVYTNNQVKDEKTGKWKSAAGTLIGKIVPEVGFCPNDNIAKEDTITCFDYGEYLLISAIAEDELKLLCRIFNKDEAMLLFFLASIFVCNGYIGLKAADAMYERSLFARDFPALRFSYRRISSLLELIGRTSKQSEFQKLCMAISTGPIAIDGHAIPTQSENSSLSSSGFKTKDIGSDYMNLVMAFDTELCQPVAAKAFPGYMLDKKSFQDFIVDLGTLKGRLILVDMGFSDEENLAMIEKDEGYFIIPVPQNRALYKEMTKPKRGRLSSFLYHRNGKTDVVEYKSMTLENGRTVAVYHNRTEQARLCADYLKNIEEGKKGYSEENFAKLKDTFGLIVLETNLGKSEKEIYEPYKARWTIETYYERLKNGINFSSLHLDDYAVTQGVAFIMLLVGRIDGKLLAAAKKVKRTRKELITLMSFLKLTSDSKGARIHNIKKEHNAVCEELQIKLDPSKKHLNPTLYA